jgi:hypothetical protein
MNVLEADQKQIRKLVELNTINSAKNVWYSTIVQNT